MQEVLTLSPGGKPLAQTLGFTAASVIVDNLTSSYVTLGDVGKTIPPWTYGAVVALPPGLRRATASLTATTPAIPGPPVPVSAATLTWTDAELPPDPGHLLQQTTTSQQTIVASLSVAAGQQTGFQTVSVPAGTQSIGYIVRSDGTNVTPSVLAIIGVQSDNEYTGTTPPNDIGGAQWYPFAVTDTQVQLNLGAPAGGPSHVDFLASPLVLALDVQQSFGTVPTAALTDSAGTPITIDTSSNGSRLVGVSLADANPATWQVVNANGSIGTGGINAAATLTVIPAGGANVRTRLRKVEFEVVAAASSVLQIECPAGTARAVVNGAVGQRVNLDFDYLDCGLNAAVAIHNTGASNSGAVNGHATANQT